MCIHPQRRSRRGGVTKIVGRVGLAATAAMVAVGGWALAPSPARAHGATATTAPAATVTAAVPAGMAGTSATAPMSVPTGAEPGEEGALPWSGLAVAVAVALVGLAALWGRAGSAGDRAAAGALMFAGVAHCALTPSHWGEGWHLGLFFAVSGLLLVGQGLALGLGATPAVHWSVLASTVAMLVLYVLAREVALPLVDHRDPYLLTDVPVKMAEAAAFGLGVLALVRARAARAARDVAPHPFLVPAP